MRIRKTRWPRINAKKVIPVEVSGLGAIADNVVIWIALWLIAALGCSVFVVVRLIVKPSRPLGTLWLVIEVGLIASGLFVAGEAWPESGPRQFR